MGRGNHVRWRESLISDIKIYKYRDDMCMYSDLLQREVIQPCTEKRRALRVNEMIRHKKGAI